MAFKLKGWDAGEGTSSDKKFIQQQQQTPQQQPIPNQQMMGATDQVAQSPMMAVPTKDKTTGLYDRPNTENKYSEENVAKRKEEKEQKRIDRKVRKAKKKITKASKSGPGFLDESTGKWVHDGSTFGRKGRKAAKKLKKAGYSEEQIEVATGAAGYKAATDWAKNK